MSNQGKAEISRLDDLKRFYSLLLELEQRCGRRRRLSDCSGRMPWPERGVYFLLEPGETRTDSGTGPRVVRVGTHALNKGEHSKLWGRLNQHRGPRQSGRGSHRNSIFRDLVGQALINRDALDYPDWGKRNDRGSGSPEIREQEQPLEKAVSRIIGEMDVLWLAVEDPPGPGNRRALIERNAIALLSNHDREALDPPSDGWLGLACPRGLVIRSSLWNQQHADARHDPAFLSVFERLVEEHTNVPAAPGLARTPERRDARELVGRSLAGRPTFVLKQKGCDARGFETETGFKVLEGSLARARWAPSHIRYSRTYFAERERLIEAGVLVRLSEPSEDETLWFAKDHTFSSATRAGFVCAGNIDDLRAWKNEETGRSLKEERGRKDSR